MAAVLLLSLACVFGALIGTRHSVAALVFVLPVAIATVGWLANHMAADMSVTLLWQCVTLIGLQIGYLAGGLLSAWDTRQLVRS